MHGRLLLCVVMGLGPVVAACGDGGRTAAEAAVSAAQSAFDAVRGDAAVYAPDEMKSVEAALSNAKGLAGNGEYEQALAGATATASRISALEESVTAKKAALTTSWTQLSEEVPTALKDLQGRVATLSKSRRLPKGVTRAELEGAKARVETLVTEFADATTAFSAGNLPEAVSKADRVKAGVAEVMAALGLHT